MESLLEWASAGGATLPKLALSEHDERTFVAAEDIAAGDTIISLPQDLLLHAHVASEDAEYGDAFRALAEELGPNTDQRHLLCLLLILERARGTESKWHAYINVLPKAYDDPYWWSADEAALVSGTRLHRAIEQYRPGLSQLAAWVAKLERSFVAGAGGGRPGVLSRYDGGWALTADAARWARSTVWSRSFTVHALRGRSGVVALVPVLDMIDHSPDVEVVWHTGPDGSSPFQFACLGAVPKGGALSNNYGCKTNDELLLAYGFVVPANPADYFHVSLGAPSVRPPAAAAPLQVCTRTGAKPRSDAAAEPAPSSMEDDNASESDSGRERCGGDGDESEDESEDESDGGAEAQAQAEGLQRELCLSTLGLPRAHRLNLADPLPPNLVHAAHACLLPPPELYLAAARLLPAAASTSGGDGGGSSSHPSVGAKRGLPGGGASGGDGARDGGSKAATRHASAMHIMPREGAAAVAAAAPPPGTSDGGGDGPRTRDAHHTPGGGDDGHHDDAAAAHLLDSVLGSVKSARRAWAADAASMPMPPPHPSGGPAGGGGGSGGGGGGCPHSVDAAAARTAAARQLPVLVSLQQQLEAKLEALASEGRARVLLRAPPGAPRLLPVSDAHEHEHDGSNVHEGDGGGSGDCSVSPAPMSAAAASAAEHDRRVLSLASSLSSSSHNTVPGAAPGSAPPAVSPHGALALVYLSSQRRILAASLSRLRRDVATAVVGMARGAFPHGVPGVACEAGSTAGGHHAHAHAHEPTHSLAHGNVALSVACFIAEPLGGAPQLLQQQQQQQLPSAIASLVAPESQHAALFAAWVARACTPPGRDAPGLAEICARPRREAVRVATAATHAFQAARASGSRSNKRKALASVTLLSLRNMASAGTHSGPIASNHGASGGGGRGGSIHSDELSAQTGPLPLPSGIAASLGLDMGLCHSSLSWGAVTTRAVATGDPLLVVSPEHCIVADSQQELLMALMVPANALLQVLVRAIAESHTYPTHGSSGKPPRGAAHVVVSSAGVSAGGNGGSGGGDGGGGGGSGSNGRGSGSNGGGISISSSSSVSDGSVSGGGPPLCGRDLLVLHLMHAVGAAPAVRLLASENDQASMLIEMLEDSPVGTSCQEAFDELKAGFGAMRDAAARSTSNGWLPMREVFAWPGALGLYCWGVATLERCAVRVMCRERGADDDNGDGAASVRWALLPLACAVPRGLQDAVLRVEQVGGPSSPLVVFAAVPLPCGLPLSPVSFLPHANVDAALTDHGPEALSWRALLAHQTLTQQRAVAAAAHYKGASAAAAAAAAAASCDRAAAASSGGADGPSTAADGEGGAHAAGGAGRDPSAAAAPPLGSMLPPQAPPLSSLAGTPFGAARERALGRGGGAGGSRAAADAAAADAGEAARIAGPRVLYELYVSPPDGDHLARRKRALLAASGLGSIHYLTAGLESRERLTAALRICAAGDDVLDHALALQALQLHHAMGLFACQAERDAHLVDAVAQPGGGASSGAAVVDAAAAAAAATTAAAAAGPGGCGDDDPAGAAAAASSGEGQPQPALPRPHLHHPHHHAPGGGGDGGVPRGFLCLLHQGQARLVSMLNGLPPEHGAAAAADKTLRHIVHDARKHTRRRLRQLSVMETRSASGSGVAFWDCGALTGSAPASSGSPAPSGSPGPRGSAVSGGVPGQGASGPPAAGPPGPPVCPTSGGMETLRLGVQLYLEELVLVLDAWCNALGIESAHEKPLSKRPKTLRAPAGRG
ncbi:hypothetical protein FOA52_004788 [Chlamydomonas sp. UWO 241]|nr:hypothetical protein FOA52_004788 [Chlamydomonas sp. UWO 241]